MPLVHRCVPAFSCVYSWAVFTTLSNFKAKKRFYIKFAIILGVRARSVAPLCSFTHPFILHARVDVAALDRPANRGKCVRRLCWSALPAGREFRLHHARVGALPIRAHVSFLPLGVSRCWAEVQG